MPGQLLKDSTPGHFLDFLFAGGAPSLSILDDSTGLTAPGAPKARPSAATSI